MEVVHITVVLNMASMSALGGELTSLGLKPWKQQTSYSVNANIIHSHAFPYIEAQHVKKVC